MDTTFYLVCNMKTGTGYETYARFLLGHDSEMAYRIFGMLKGETNVTKNSVLTIEMVESKDGLPLNLKILSCTLDELSENCKIITKEVFKAVNLTDM